MRNASGGCSRAPQRQQEDDPSVREVHKAEAGNRPHNYNKTIKQNKGRVLSTRRLAVVTSQKWITMLKASFCGKPIPPDAGPLEAHPPRRWPFLVLFLLVFLVLLVATLGSNSWLRLWIPQRPSTHSNDEIAILLRKYGLMTGGTNFGDTLVPSLWMQLHSPLGPEIFKLQRAIQLQSCSIEFKSSNKNNDTERKAVANELTANVTGFVSEQCPSYFNWIQEDLAPWNDKRGITRTTIELTKKHAAFRAIIAKGELYIELYYACFQTRVLFTVWGLLLLLEKYKNRIPDVEFMFSCEDRPKVKIDAKMVLPLFGYCSNRDFYDIPWPDWTFWGWSELELESWDQEFDKIVKTSAKKSWRQKVKKAYWRGNPFVRKHTQSELADWRYKVLSYREQLRFCENTTKKSKLNVVTQTGTVLAKTSDRGINEHIPSILRFACAIRTRIFRIHRKGHDMFSKDFAELAENSFKDWEEELANGKQNSHLADQCTHRYMLYVEGVTWSTSLKYIMACGSPTMVISPRFYDFFSRGLQPGVHYIRVDPQNSCVSKVCLAIDDKIDQAEWNLLETQQIGKRGQAFMEKELGMSNVYDYMFHVLNEYAKLQKFETKIPESAHLVTQDYMMCIALPIQRLMLKQVKKLMPYSAAPCTMSQHPKEFKDFGWEAFKSFDKTC